MSIQSSYKSCSDNMQIIKKGYKPTEIGLIPEDWEVISVDEISKITTGDKDTQNKIADGKYPFFVRSQEIERINSYSFDGEAVLTSGDGVGVGKIFHYIKGKFDFHQRVYSIHDFNKYDGKFFYYYFSNHFFERVMQMTAKSSVDSVRREMISNMNIPLPPTLQEQQAIAQVLSDTDRCIESIVQLIAKKKAIKQGAMQELLTGKKRLTGFDREWETKKLGELFEVTAGGDLDKESYSDTKSKKYCYPIYSNSHSKKGLYGFSKYFNYEGHFVTISARGGIGFTVYRNEKFNAVGRLLVLKPKIDISCKFIEEFINLNVEFSNESTSVPQLTAPQVSRYFVLQPQIQEQQAIAQILSDMDAEIEALTAQLHKTKALKQGLMQELLTGKTRLVKTKNYKQQDLKLNTAAEP